MKSLQHARGSIGKTIGLFLVAAVLLLSGCNSAVKPDSAKGFYEIAVMSDVHVPGNNLPLK